MLKGIAAVLDIYKVLTGNLADWHTEVFKAG